MPTYEYSCPIHNIFEVQQSIKDEPLKFCPHCQDEGKETNVQKLISSSSFVLQGSGWSRDNYS